MSRPPETLGEWLRAAYADEAAGCPPPAAWLAEEMAAMAPADRQRLEAHAAGCPACAAERELAAAFDGGAAGERAADVAWIAGRLAATASDAAPPAARGNSPRGAVVAFPQRRAVVRWVRLAAAAVLVVAAGLMFQTLTLSRPPLPAPPERGQVRGGRVEAVVPNGELPAIPSELRWEPLAGATAYRVRLLAADDTELWQSTVGEPSAALPAAVMAQIQRAVSYRWGVEALAADGTVLGRSEAVRFRVTPAPEAAEETER